MKFIPIVGLNTIEVEFQVIWVLLGGAIFASVVGVCQKSSQGLLVYLSIVSSG